jgi:hypothetical protein
MSSICTAVLIGRDPTTPLPMHLGSYKGAQSVSQDRRHLFVTPYLGSMKLNFDCGQFEQDTPTEGS